MSGWGVRVGAAVDGARPGRESGWVGSRRGKLVEGSGDARRRRMGQVRVSDIEAGDGLATGRGRRWKVER